MALDPSNSSNLEQLALKGLTTLLSGCRRRLQVTIQLARSSNRQSTYKSSSTTTQLVEKHRNLSLLTCYCFLCFSALTLIASVVTITFVHEQSHTQTAPVLSQNAIRCSRFLEIQEGDDKTSKSLLVY